jgi:predicted nucleic-acid-binding protein
MIGLDTNILLRATVQDDPRQTPAARKIIAGLTEHNPGHINLLVLAEYAWTLERRYEYAPDAIAAVIEAMLASNSFVVADHEIVSRALERMSEDNLRLSDALIGELNRAAGCADTLTFDRAAARSELFNTVD